MIKGLKRLFGGKAEVAPASVGQWTSRRPSRNRSAAVLPLNYADKDNVLAGSTGINGFRLSHLYRLRQMAVADPILVSYLWLAKNGVVGNVPLRPSFNNLSNTNAADRLRELWMEFEDAPTVDGVTSYRQFMRAVTEQYLVDGRLFAVTKYHEDYPQGIALLPVPREILADTGISKENLYGLKYADSGRVEGYHFYAAGMSAAQWNHYRLGMQWLGGGGETTLVPRERVHDIANIRRTDHYDNNASHLVAALNALVGVDKLDESTLLGMRAGACNMGFFEKSENAPTGEDGEKPIEDYDLPERTAIGDISELPPGWTFKAYDPGFPNADVVAYRSQLLRASIGSLGADYNSVTTDGSGVNYNTLRHMTLQVRETWTALQGDLKERLVRPFLKQWIDNQRVRGALPQLSEADYRKACKTHIDTRSYAWVDPVKDAKARFLQLQSGGISIKDIAAENGRSVRDILRDNAEVADMLNEPGMEEKVKKVLNTFAAWGLAAGDPDDQPPENNPTGGTE